LSDVVGAVAALWRFPVKSMQGEQVSEAELTEQGVVGDRAYALIDAQTGKVASGKSVTMYPTLLACRASFVEPPRPGREPPIVQISLPEGAQVTSDSPRVNSVLSNFFGRDVVLARSAPEDFTIDQYHPDVEDPDSAGVVVEQKLGSALFGEVGLPSPVAVGSFLDAFPVSVLTTATLRRLKALRSDTAFEPRRFRMNVIVDTDQVGFAENNWVGRGLHLADEVRLRVALPDPRCVMTTLAQEDLPRDNEVLRTLVHHNRIDLPGGLGRLPCAGVYAVVELPGTARVGDQVVVD